MHNSSTCGKEPTMDSRKMVNAKVVEGVQGRLKFLLPSLKTT